MRRTPLYEMHKRLGARMVDFAGWEMPVQYQGVGEEHRAVRTGVGLFDVSHMGEINVRGSRALNLVQRVACNDASRLQPGMCQYSALLTEQGTFVDDVIVNCVARDHYLICVNASNSDKDYEWIRLWAAPDATVENVSANYFQLALQGPKAANLLSTLGVRLASPLPEKSFRFVQTTIDGRQVLVARTGYTGEDGFEIYGDPKDAPMIWSLMLELGAVPCGLGARDTLRLEAALSLYGHEITDAIHPYQARLGWIVKLAKDNFIGRETLVQAKADLDAGLVSPLLVGMEMVGAGIARQGHKIFNAEGREIGAVVSGTKTPTIGKAIALGYVEAAFAPVGTRIDIDIHQKKREARVVNLPFYKKA